MERFDGWRVVAAVFLLLMVNAGLGFYGLAVFLEAITSEQDFSVASVSAATSIFFVVQALAGRAIAPLIERYDIRIAVFLGGVIAGAGLVLIGASGSLPALYASYVLFAVGVALSGLVPATTLITRWFQVRRSIALSIASTGLSVGGLTFTPAAGVLIDRSGMADATPWLALMYLVTVIVSLVALWPDPAGRGQLPDGRPPETGAPAATGTPYERAIRSTFFRFTTLGFLLVMGAQVGGIAQLANLGAERVDAGTGTLLVSTLAFASVIARLVGGVVAARTTLITMTALLAAVQSLSLLWLGEAMGRTALVLAAALFGCTIGNLLMLQPLVLADRFGVAHYPRIFALSQLVAMGIGVAGGPYLLGALRDLVSYRLSYLVAAIVSLAGAACFAAARGDRWEAGSVDEDQVGLAGAAIGD